MSYNGIWPSTIKQKWFKCYTMFIPTVASLFHYQGLALMVVWLPRASEMYGWASWHRSTLAWMGNFNLRMGKLSQCSTCPIKRSSTTEVLILQRASRKPLGKSPKTLMSSPDYPRNRFLSSFFQKKGFYPSQVETQSPWFVLALDWLFGLSSNKLTHCKRSGKI